MLREVYGIEESVDEAPPRLSLQMFGGPFKIDTFRKQVNPCTTITPPFVSYCMLIEERTPQGGQTNERNEGVTTAKGSVRGLKRPVNRAQLSAFTSDLGEPMHEGMYSEFLREKQQETVETEPMAVDEEKTTVKRRAASTSTAGSKRPATSGLAKFAVQSS